jgi:transcriptional regulator with XRE-family HTH domain
MKNVIDLASHPARASSSKGYRSGRNSLRETPEARSTSSTRSGGTSTHWATACLVMFKEAASRVRPPAAMMARSRGVSDMGTLSSTTSLQSQDRLHLHRQAVLYAVPMPIGTLIKKARKAKGMVLEALAAEMGVTKQLVWQWERGDSDPRKHIERLSQVLGMPVDYFYGPDGAPTTIEVKIKLLSPALRELIDMMADTLLRQQEEELGSPAKKA